MQDVEDLTANSNSDTSELVQRFKNGQLTRQSIHRATVFKCMQHTPVDW